MRNKVTQIFSLGDRQYHLVEVEGPIQRGNGVFPAQFDHDAGVLKISKTVPLDRRAWVVAVAISDACFRLWRPIPVIWPNWLPDESLPDDPPAFSPRRPGPAGDPPHQ